MLLTLVIYGAIIYLNEAEIDRFKDIKLLCMGCSKGVGRATAELILKEGGSVVSCSRKLDNLKWNEQYDNGYATICDVTIPSHYNESLSFAIDKMGAINAAFYVPTFINLDRQFFEPANVEDLVKAAKSYFQFDFEGPLRAIKATLPVLKVNGGSFLALSSIGAQSYSPGGQFAYGAMKRALEYMIQNSAFVFGEYKIRYNIVRMGAVKSNIWDSLPPEMISKIFNMISYRQPFPRVGTVEDCANLFAFLLSNESKFITGTIMNIDGGAPLTTGFDGAMMEEFYPPESLRDSWIKTKNNPDVFKRFQPENADEICDDNSLKSDS
eukprot:782263_1